MPPNLKESAHHSDFQRKNKKKKTMNKQFNNVQEAVNHFCTKETKINDFETLRKKVSEHGEFVEVTEELFYYALNVLPPIYLKNGTFQMGECYSGDLYYTFGQKDGKCYGCLCNKNFSINNF